MANWINKVKTFLAAYGVGVYGVTRYGEGNTYGSTPVNKNK